MEQGDFDLIYTLAILASETKSFRELCQRTGITITHQRQVLYEVMKMMHGHPSPEEVYAQARKKVPAISLATVYKNIHLFVESGVFREVSLHHGSVRVEMNREPHHHRVCLKCKRDYGSWREGTGTGPDAGSVAFGISRGALCGGCDWRLRKMSAESFHCPVETIPFL